MGKSIFYAWNPLVVVEVSASAHHDVLVIAALLAAVFYTLTSRPFRAMMTLAASVLVKTYPLMMVPFFSATCPGEVLVFTASRHVCSLSAFFCGIAGGAH